MFDNDNRLLVITAIVLGVIFLFIASTLNLFQYAIFAGLGLLALWFARKNRLVMILLGIVLFLLFVTNPYSLPNAVRSSVGEKVADSNCYGNIICSDFQILGYERYWGNIEDAGITTEAWCIDVTYQRNDSNGNVIDIREETMIAVKYNRLSALAELDSYRECSRNPGFFGALLGF